jgi:hypothetical protein
MNRVILVVASSCGYGQRLDVAVTTGVAESRSIRGGIAIFSNSGADLLANTGWQAECITG